MNRKRVILDASFVTKEKADARHLATSETSGDLERLFRWMYGSTNKFITIEILDALAVTQEAIATGAYRRWEERCSHGHDLQDWFSSESELYDQLWQKLFERKILKRSNGP